MDNAQNYIEANKKLIQTMVIKSEQHAQLLNEEIKLKYPNIPVYGDNPETWKYYLNLAGLPHVVNKEIYVTSFDTQEEILFNSENLALHKQTRKNYLIGTKNYYILLKKYPEEEMFINGALYPVDIDDAIAAKDLSILWYDKTLVEEQEISLVDKLQEFINGYDVRWNVRPFSSSDPLYPAAQHAIFTLNLLQKLLNIRLNNCHTSEVHSFHIKNYLASHYGLDQYMPYMTIRQIIFLYKNIRYIERNIGKVDTFKILVQRLIEERRLVPLYEVAIKQLHSIDNDMLPIIQASKKRITSSINASEKDYLDIQTFEDYQRPLANDNDWYLDNFNQVIRHKLATDDTNTIKTKFLMSDLIDYTDVVPYTLQEALFKHWVSMANEGSYNSYTEFYNTLDGSTNYLHVSESFIYFLYITKCYYGMEVNEIPTFLNSKKLKTIKPTVNELLALVPNKVKRKLKPIAIEIISRMPQINYTITVDSFFDLSKSIYDYAQWQWYLISNTHDLDTRAYIKAMCDYTFVDEHITLDTPYSTYTEFLEEKGLPEYTDEPIKAIQLLVNIYIASTGFVVDKYTQLRFIQDMLVNALLLLSSYSINVIKKINKNKIILGGFTAIRIGNEHLKLKTKEYIEDLVDVVDKGGSVAIDTPYNLNLANMFMVNVNWTTGTSYEVGVLKGVVSKSKVDVFFHSSVQCVMVNDYYEYLNTLTSEQIAAIPVID